MRTVVYVRVSTLRQAQAQTIEQQLDRLRTCFQARSTSCPLYHSRRLPPHDGIAQQCRRRSRAARHGSVVTRSKAMLADGAGAVLQRH